VKEKWVEVNVFVLMSSHIHLIWQIQNGYERAAVQRNFLKFISQTIKRDLQKKYPQVLEKFYVGAKDREYLPIAIGMEMQSIEYRLLDKEIFIQKMEYIHYNPVTAGLCNYPEDYKYSPAKFYETGLDQFDIITHWMA
jgi:putative transposase